MNNFEDNVDKLLSQSRDAQDQEVLLRADIEAAKPGAFNVFLESSKKAAMMLGERNVQPETFKKVIVDQIPKKKWLGLRVALDPVAVDLRGWTLHEDTCSPGSDYSYEESFIRGVMVDTKGELYHYKDETATPLQSFDEAVEVIGSTQAFSLERVHDLAEFWEDKVTRMVVRVIEGAPYTPYS